MKNLLFMFFLGFGIILTNWANAAVSVSLPEISATKGDTIEVPLTVSDLTGQNVFDFNGVINFRENVVDFLGASASGCITTQAGWSQPTVNISEDGQAIFASFGANTLAGAGDLIKLKFHVHGDYGDSTSLDFASIEFTRTSNISPVKDNGKIKIKLKPIRVVVTSNKGGQLQVIVDGQRHTVPYSATWTPGETHSISIDEMQNGSEGSRFYFESWSNGGSRTHDVAPMADVTFMANLRAEYYLKIQSDYSTPQGEGWYPENTLVQIQVDSVHQLNPTKRAHFNSWNGSGAAGYTGTENPASVTLSGPVTQTAVWETQYWLGVKTLPENVTTLSGSGWYNENLSATTGWAPPQVGNRSFKGWKVDGNSVTGNPITILMSDGHEAVADYSFDITVTVTTSSGEGIVIIDGQTADAPAQRTWSAGSNHTIGVPETQGEQDGIRFRFMGWSDGGEMTHSITPQTNMTYTALLTNEYYLNVQTQPSSLGQLDGTGWYAPNTLVMVGPAPETFNPDGTIYSFYAWQLNGSLNESSVFNIVMDQPKSATAIYYKNYYIAGQIKSGTQPVANVKVRLTGGANDSVFTNEHGNYVFQGIRPEKYTVVPVSNEFSFFPQVWNYGLLFTNKKLQNFSAADIGAPKVQLLQPNGGERYTASSMDSIKWTATDNVGIDSIRCFYSSDEGQSWHLILQFSADFTSCPWIVPQKNGTKYRVKVEAVDLAKNVGADVSDGNFEIYGGVGVEKNFVQNPTRFCLRQNYPNPFNPTTEITYQLPVDSRVQLNIFNVSGQLIRNLVNEIQTKGIQRVVWNGLDDRGHQMSSGVYYYQMKAGVFAETRKMLLMR